MDLGNRENTDKLARFNEAYKIILVVASLAWSTTLALERDTMGPLTLLYLLVFFVGAVAFAAYGTLHGRGDECRIKVVSWWMLMIAFTLLIMHLAVPSSFALPPFFTAASSFLAIILTRPVIAYFKYLMAAKDVKRIRAALWFTFGLSVALDVVYYVLSLYSL